MPGRRIRGRCWKLYVDAQNFAFFGMSDQSAFVGDFHRTFGLARRRHGHTSANSTFKHILATLALTAHRTHGVFSDAFVDRDLILQCVQVSSHFAQHTPDDRVIIDNHYETYTRPPPHHLPFYQRGEYRADCTDEKKQARTRLYTVAMIFSIANRETLYIEARRYDHNPVMRRNRPRLLCAGIHKYQSPQTSRNRLLAPLTVTDKKSGPRYWMAASMRLAKQKAISQSTECKDDGTPHEKRLAPKCGPVAPQLSRFNWCGIWFDWRFVHSPFPSRRKATAS